MAAAQLGTNETIRDLGDFFASGGHQAIGALVFWSLSGVQIERAALRAEFEAIGMGAAVPRDPRHSTSLTTAIHQMCVGKPNVLARKVGKGWGIVIEDTQQVEERPGEVASRLKHVHAATVYADPMELSMRRRAENAPQQKALELEWRFTPAAHQVRRVFELAQEVEQKFLDARAYLDTSDLSTILVNAMHGTTKDALLGAVSLRQTAGGLYFVHASRLGVLHQLRDALQRLAPQSDISVLTITGSADNLGAASKAARQSFQLQLADLKREVQEFRATTPLGNRSERNITTRADHYRQLAGRVELFRDVLGGIADELGNEIEGARGELERLLDAP